MSPNPPSTKAIGRALRHQVCETLLPGNGHLPDNEAKVLEGVVLVAVEELETVEMLLDEMSNQNHRLAAVATTVRGIAARLYFARDLQEGMYDVTRPEVMASLEEFEDRPVNGGAS